MKTRLLLLVLLCALLAAIPCSVLAFEWYHAERIYPGISVHGVDLGGLRLEEAIVALEEGVGLSEPTIKLYGPARSWSVRPADLGLRLDIYATLTPVYNVGRERPSLSSSGPVLGPTLQSWWRNLQTHFWLLANPADFSPVFIYDEHVAQLYLETLAEGINYPSTAATLSFDGITPVASPAQPGRHLNMEATLDALAPAVQQLGPAEVTLVVHEVLPAISDAETARAEAEALLDGPLTLVLDEPREGDPGPWVLSPEQLLSMMAVVESDGELHTTLDEDALRFYLTRLTTTLAIEPVDARFHFDETLGQLEPISPSVEGRALDVDASLAQIAEQVPAGRRFISLTVHSVPPRYPDTATAEELGIVELVAEGDSYFIGSPSGRDHNIRLATPKFDGIVVGPGETFSFNHYLGEVTAEAGYDESYITAGEQLAIEVGGGICQVSTTAFRAAFWGGYPIDQRWYHNHRVGYYELRGAGLGMDATVYSPLVDFKFTNDRDYPLLIETQVEEGSHRLVFRFYSTGDGRRVEKEGPEITDEAPPGPPIYQLDEDLAPGTVIKWQSAVSGLTAVVGRRVYAADDNLIYTDAFVSKYAARRAAYHYGPGYEPPEQEGEQ